MLTWCHGGTVLSPFLPPVPDPRHLGWWSACTLPFGLVESVQPKILVNPVHSEIQIRYQSLIDVLPKSEHMHTTLAHISFQDFLTSLRSLSLTLINVVWYQKDIWWKEVFVCRELRDERYLENLASFTSPLSLKIQRTRFLVRGAYKSLPFPSRVIRKYESAEGSPSYRQIKVPEYLQEFSSASTQGEGVTRKEQI